jgi:hypothetical protein
MSNVIVGIVQAGPVHCDDYYGLASQLPFRKAYPSRTIASKMKAPRQPLRISCVFAIAGTLRQNGWAPYAQTGRRSAPRGSTDCQPFVSRQLKMWLRGRATAGTCSCGAGRRESEHPEICGSDAADFRC